MSSSGKGGDSLTRSTEVCLDFVRLWSTSGHPTKVVMGKGRLVGCVRRCVGGC